MEKEIPVFRSLFRVFDFYVAYFAPETSAGALSSFGLMCVCTYFCLVLLSILRLLKITVSRGVAPCCSASRY
jgi:hypothetical protein